MSYNKYYGVGGGGILLKFISQPNALYNIYETKAFYSNWLSYS